MRPESAAQIALVNVPYGGGGEQSMRPIGLSYLGAYLLAQGVSAKGFDFSDSARTAEELVDVHGLCTFPIVGLSYYNTNARIAYAMARAIKAGNPRCIVIGGGPHASATYATVFDRHPEIDIVVRNEGEQALLEVIRALEDGRSLEGIAGISFRSVPRARPGGLRMLTESPPGVSVGPEPVRINNLDELPAPVFDFVSDKPEKQLLFFDKVAQRFKNALAVVSSRSCPYSCSFCAIILIGRQWRRASPEKVISDIRAVEQHSGRIYEHIYFMDANFFVDPKHARRVAQALKVYRDTMTFSFSTRVNQLIKSASMLPELKHLGLRAVELGIESGSAAALMRFAKDTTPEQNYEAVRLLREHDLHLFLDFVMFDAEATVEDLEANVRFFEKAHIDSYVPWEHIFSSMTPYLGTQIRTQYETLMGTTFDEDGLPDPISLFQHDGVRAVFREIQRLLSYTARLSDAIYRCEEFVRRARTWDRDVARAKLNATTLRRLPFVVLRDLIAQARRGEPVSLDTAMPAFMTDDGSPLELSELLASITGGSVPPSPGPHTSSRRPSHDVDGAAAPVATSA